MKAISLFLGFLVVLIASCSTIDDYDYGYAPAYRTLPEGFEQVEIGGTPYWHHGGRFYQYDSERGYLLVKPPRGHEQVVAATSAGTPDPNGTPATTAAAPAARSGNPLRDIFTPGGGTVKERTRPRTVGRSPLRRGTVIRD